MVIASAYSNLKINLHQAKCSISPTKLMAMSDMTLKNMVYCCKKWSNSLVIVDVRGQGPDPKLEPHCDCMCRENRTWPTVSIDSICDNEKHIARIALNVMFFLGWHLVSTKTHTEYNWVTILVRERASEEREGGVTWPFRGIRWTPVVIPYQPPCHNPQYQNVKRWNVFFLLWLSDGWYYPLDIHFNI